VNSLVESLPVVVLYPHNRCNCRCLMCDIWKETEGREIGAAEFDRYLDDFSQLKVRWVVLSGGEPLMHSNWSRLCELLRARGIRTTVLSTGILFERDARRIAECVDDLIVSLDGPPLVHDRIRRLPGAFGLLARGIDSIRAFRPDMPIAARSTVQRENYRDLRETAVAAERLGLKSISFLAADVASEAFNRPGGWSPARQSEIALSEYDLPKLDAEIEALIERWDGSDFLADAPEKLRRIALHYRAHLGLATPRSPVCNAPWVSAVIETDGTVRPCFFQRPIGNAAGGGLVSVLNSETARTFRESLDIESDPICQRCVCSLNLPMA
jgi:MoaA/NifB/PqqE/SkfB family radical SAM enzyme